jgi:hypothetical protein
VFAGDVFTGEMLLLTELLALPEDRELFLELFSEDELDLLGTLFEVEVFTSVAKTELISSNSASKFNILDYNFSTTTKYISTKNELTINPSR